MKAEISFDLVMEEEMEFVEGTYRIAGQEWQVFIFGPDSSVKSPKITFGNWESGITGLFVAWPKSLRLNKAVVLHTLSEALGAAEWEEVRGPDSIMLR